MLFNILTASALIAAGVSADFVAPSIWPLPSSATYDETAIPLSHKLKFQIIHERTSHEIKTSKNPTMQAAFERYTSLMFPHSVDSEGEGAGVRHVKVTLKDLSEDYPQLDTDESYTLNVAAEEGGGIELSAATVYGAMRGLESLSQLVFFDYDTHAYYVYPAAVEDTPRYAHRGMLLDTARHYQPMAALRRTVDALSYAKYNVLHWHVVDTQSFPFESTSRPKLWEGAYTKAERYTQQDVKDLVEYARLRGVKVMIEFDMPGHAGSWCAGYPEICPSPTCTQPLNPASNETFPLITALLDECTGSTVGGGLFPYSLLHLGGDEVSYGCWETSEEVQAWEDAQGFSGSEDTYEYFVDQAAQIARSQARTPVQWVEVYEHFGNKLDNNTIVHVWKAKSTMDGALSDGYRVLLSDEDRWYLDHLGTTWEQMYLNEPTDGLSATSDPTLIVGGESCMWGETVDPSDLDNTVWPRAAAVSERLWTSLESITAAAADMDEVTNRLETFRCLLNSRGIGAAPVLNNSGRQAPPNPGSCYSQRRHHL